MLMQYIVDCYVISNLFINHKTFAVFDPSQQYLDFPYPFEKYAKSRLLLGICMYRGPNGNAGCRQPNLACCTLNFVQSSSFGIQIHKCIPVLCVSVYLRVIIPIIHLYGGVVIWTNNLYM